MLALAQVNVAISPKYYIGNESTGYDVATAQKILRSYLPQLTQSL